HRRVDRRRGGQEDRPVRADRRFLSQVRQDHRGRCDCIGGRRREILPPQARRHAAGRPRLKSLLFFLLSGLKWGKVATTGGTMLLSLAIYATIWGWRYAAGFIWLLFVHEMGHYVAARQRGLAVGAPTFIPFVGAWITLKEQPVDVETEAYVAMAGPFVGTIGALAVYLWGRSSDSGVLLAIAYAGLFLNLLNLLPISPLDGGRITAILSPRVWLLGAPMMLALLLYR